RGRDVDVYGGMDVDRDPRGRGHRSRSSVGRASPLAMTMRHSLAELMVPFFGCFDPGDPAATTMGDPLTSTSSFSSTDGASDTFTEHSSTAADGWSSTMTEEAGPAGGESGSSSESTMGVEESSDGTTVASSSTSDVPDESSGNSGAPDDTTGEPFRCAIN